MKAATFALAVALSAVQTVGWVECCCILICKHRNDPCSDCKEKKEAETHADCCAKKDAAPKPPEPAKRCSHVEPSSEVVSDAPSLPDVALDLVVDLPAIPVLPAPVASATDDLRATSRGSPPPLHLLYSVLLI